MHAKDFLIQNYPTLQQKDSISVAISLINRKDTITDFPLLEGEDFIGILKGNPLLKHLSNFETNTPLKDIDLDCSKIRVSEKQHIFSLLKLANIENVQTLPVFNIENILLGIVYIPDIYKYISDTYALQLEGGIIVLKMKQIEYSLYVISQIVEYEKKQILASWVSEADEIGYMYISLKLDSLHLENIISCFEKTGYEICSAYPYVRDESKYESILKFLDF